MKETFGNVGRILFRPIESYNEIKHVRYYNWWFVGGILTFWFVVQIMYKQCSGFRFNVYNPDNLNIYVELLRSAALFILFCVCNWGICALMDGEGRFCEICTACAYAMVPYLCIKSITIFLSNIMTFNEAVFLHWIHWIGIAWSTFLVFQAIRIIHQYSTPKTIAALFLSVIGIAIVLFIILLLFALFQQIYAFFSTVTNEILLRR